jgi:aryl-alcohol dehydrogenase-like predicted oxidoreductase
MLRRRDLKESVMTAAGMRPGSAPGGTADLAGRRVARVGFGVMQLERAAVDKDTALAVLRQAVGGGVNHLDTAQFYGRCNGLIRDALAPYDDNLVLASKVGADLGAGGGLVPARMASPGCPSSRSARPASRACPR